MGFVVMVLMVFFLNVIKVVGVVGVIMVVVNVLMFCYFYKKNIVLFLDLVDEMKEVLVEFFIDKEGEIFFFFSFFLVFCVDEEGEGEFFIY